MSTVQTASVYACKIQVSIRDEESGNLEKCVFLDAKGFPLIRPVGLIEASSYPDLVKAKQHANAYLDNLHRKPNQLVSLVDSVDKGTALLVSIDVVELSGDTLDTIASKVIHRSMIRYHDKVAEPYYPSVV